MGSNGLSILRRGADSRESSFREQMLQHVFISEVLQEVWLRHRRPIKIVRSEVDSSGYDLVMEYDNITRHVQLKSSRPDAATARLTIDARLAQKASGCVVWLLYRVRPDMLRIELSYRFFGSDPGRPLPPLEKYEVAHHARGEGKGARPGLHIVPKTDFSAEMDLRHLLARLFGPTFNPQTGA